MVCDWHGLNRITIKNQACLLNIDNLLDAVQGSTYFTMVDLRSGYNQIRFVEAATPKSTINTLFGHFQFTIMGFGLTNVPATFRTLMNTILQPYLRKFVVVLLDDILIFSKSWKDHLNHFRFVLITLRSDELYSKPSKCEFGNQMFSSPVIASTDYVFHQICRGLRLSAISLFQCWSQMSNNN